MINRDGVHNGSEYICGLGAEEYFSSRNYLRWLCQKSLCDCCAGFLIHIADLVQLILHPQYERGGVLFILWGVFQNYWQLYDTV